MIVIDEKLLTEFRRKVQCEWCGKPTPSGCDPHHLFSRGHGGGSRLDVRRNLVGLCRDCHNSHHNGHEPMRLDLLAVVAQREQCLQGDIEEEIYRLRRTLK